MSHFGGEQPGDTFYFSPLAVYCFGLVDASVSPEQLHCYGYTEDQGAKGGNNVASLLLRAVNDLGWMYDDKCGKRLSVIMDNYSSQNKNGHVLQFQWNSSFMLGDTQKTYAIVCLAYSRNGIILATSIALKP